MNDVGLTCMQVQKTYDTTVSRYASVSAKDFPDVMHVSPLGHFDSSSACLSLFACLRWFRQKYHFGYNMA